MEKEAQAEKFLREMGLSQYEAAAYLSLYRSSPLNASEVSKDSGVPRGRVYDVLQSLESMGLIISSPSRGKANLFHTAPHTEALEGLRDRRIHELDEEKARARGLYGQLMDTLSGISRETSREPEEEALTVIHGLAARDYYMKKMLEKVEMRVTTNFTAQQLERYRDAIKSARERGVEFTFMLSSDESTRVTEILKGSKVYTIPTEGTEHQAMRLLGPVRPPLMILDDEVCVLFLYNSEDGLLIRSPELIGQAKFVMGHIEKLACEAGPHKA